MSKKNLIRILSCFVIIMVLNSFVVLGDGKR